MKTSFNILISFLIAFLLVSIFAIEVSPFYHEPCTNDSAVFYLTGKQWMQGYLPYRDIWELKGPLIFLFNGIGYLLTKSILGVYLLQLLFISVSVFLTHKFLLLEFNNKHSWQITILIYIQLSCLYLGGNNLEGYILPFLLLSFYYIYKWTNNVSNGGDFNHCPLHAMLYGFVLGFSLMSRLTNAIGVCAAVAVISITLIYKCQWKNLGLNILAFLAGFAIIVLPFIIYFEYYDLQYEMWYASLLFGLEYASSSGFDILSIKGLANIALRFVDNYLLIFTSILLLCCSKKKKFAGMMWFIVSSLTFTWFLRSNGFSHYLIIALPYACISFIELNQLYQENKESWLKNIKISIITIYLILSLIGCIYTIWLFTSMYLENEELKATRSILKGLPNDYKNSFVTYNTNPQIYVYEDIRPVVKYHSLQDFVIEMGPSLEQPVRDEFMQKKPHWLLVKEGETKIDDILHKYYKLTKKENGLLLYEIII